MIEKLASENPQLSESSRIILLADWTFERWLMPTYREMLHDKT